MKERGQPGKMSRIHVIYAFTNSLAVYTLKTFFIWSGTHKSNYLTENKMQIRELHEKIHYVQINTKFKHCSFRPIASWWLKVKTANNKLIFKGTVYTWRSSACFHKGDNLWLYICLCWGFTAQSTQWGHVERGQFT